jgi:hypothetical protein
MKSSGGEKHRRLRSRGWPEAGAWCVLLLLLGVIGPQHSQLLAAEVLDVRVALHGEFIRFVFDADGPVMVGQPVLDSQDVILLPFPGMSVRTDGAGFWKPLTGVESLRFYDWNPVTVARISLSFPVIESRVLTLDDPDRVVLDLFFDPAAFTIDPQTLPASSSPPPAIHRSPRSSPGLIRGTPTEASSVPLSEWLAREDNYRYRPAVILLGGLLLLGIVAYVVLSIRKARTWSGWNNHAAGPPTSEIDLIELDSMIQREMNRYERLSRLEQSR